MEVRSMRYADPRYRPERAAMSTTPPDTEAESKIYSTDQWILGGTFAAGLAMLPDHRALGSIFAAIGFGGLVYLRFQGHAMSTHLRRLNVPALILLACALVVIGYDIFDRRYGSPSEVRPPVTGTADVPANVNRLRIEADITPPYEVFATPSWATVIVPTERAAGYFELAFMNPAPRGGATVDWQVIPIPASKAKSKELSSQFAERDQQLRALQSEVAQLYAHQWPVLSDRKKGALISALRSAGRSTLTISCNDDDCEALADDIKDAAQKADWNPTLVSGALHGMQSGLWFCGPIDQNETRDRLAKALEDATGAHVESDILDKGYFLAIGRRPRS